MEDSTVIIVIGIICLILGYNLLVYVLLSNAHKIFFHLDHKHTYLIL